MSATMELARFRPDVDLAEVRLALVTSTAVTNDYNALAASRGIIAVEPFRPRIASVEPLISRRV